MAKRAGARKQSRKTAHGKSAAKRRINPKVAKKKVAPAKTYLTEPHPEIDV